MNDSSLKTAETKKIFVLILEDDYEQAELIHDFLELAGPFSVDIACDLKTLWERMDKQAYDILLLDYRLPDGTGLDVLKEFPNRGFQIPVIMVTGQGDEKVAARAIQQGALDYIVKGTDHLINLPGIIQKSIRTHQMQLSIQDSLEQIKYQALLLNNVRDAVVVWDLVGKITYWNPAAQFLFGWTATERLGKKVEECYFNMFEPEVLVLPGDYTSGQEIERECQTKDGRTIWVSSRVATLRDHSATNLTIGYMDVVRNITERKRMQAQIQSAQTHLIQSARLAAIGELASGIAHQLSNPLTTVIAETQMLLHSLASDHPGRESAEAIEKAGWRVQEAIERLLEFSRPMPNTLDQVWVNDTIQRALQLIGDQIIASGVRLEVALEEHIPPVQGNARQLEDLWVNLLLLARDATRHNNGQKAHIIEVRSKPDSLYAVVVDIADDGTPIPPEQIYSIFEPNFIGPSCGRGSGLELSICREIVRQAGGQISVESNPERGTIFRIKLPFASGFIH